MSWGCWSFGLRFTTGRYLKVSIKTSPLDLSTSGILSMLAKLNGGRINATVIDMQDLHSHCMLTVPSFP